MSTVHEFSVGMLVRVPWGLDYLEGQVEAVYGSGEAAKLAISLHVPEADEPETLTLPARLASPVDPDRAKDSVGHWLEAYKFWEEVSATVGRLLAERDVRISSELHLANDTSDIVVTSPDGTTVFIEVKAGRTITRRSIADTLSHISRYADSGSGPVKGLLVVPTEIPVELRDVVSEFSRAEHPVEVVTWRGHDDDAALQAALDRPAA